MIEEKKHIFKFMWWKDYKNLKDAIAELKTDKKDFDKKIQEKDKQIYEYNLKISELEKQDEKNQETMAKLSINLTDRENVIGKLEENISKLKKEKFDQKVDFQNKMREVNGRIGGMQAYINKLQKELEELKKLNKEDGYKHSRVPGSTMPRKKQPAKETIRPIRNIK